MSNQISKNELKYWLSFNQINEIGPVRFQKILAYFPDLKTAWQASIKDLREAGLEPKIIEQIKIKRHEISPDQELEKIQALKIQAVTILDETYPKLLKEIYAPPPILYYQGNFDTNNEILFSVVGTRKISPYGRQVTEQIVYNLAANGLNIVSGLALGIDACAHQAALNANGKTIAVLGCGLNQIYPVSNQQLAKKIIAAGGTIISEFPLGTPPYKSNFPQRNRIISGLSFGTLVTQANLNSGALITAQFALEQNREVFAVPGDINRLGSQGPNQLIKNGAKMVSAAGDILEFLNIKRVNNIKTANKILPQTQEEKNILEALINEPQHIDKIAQLVRLDISVVSATLTVMEMKGLVKNLGNQVFAKS
ncbi:MAG: DNA protecting protein DprA [Candidatus Buchananbacteria bacterium RIFCSPHIGHO2_01_FULL_39_14]|uniref:DNA protecting protein DprA n=2 Tax=Candidatus Buchananiibacteriota TaxID=1817903 RepID=A0A1G1YNG6_9BACT|nr:MAG: DNA protecting protein DprA [Candidatus Buchananbacteria bacterium RIFCSPHIGHO2_01_FULL_39_14]OGY48585.1 MAG: DNA protecting protein DprA [Candidatus Buchananbacteria bacterium RIFCSPHIGHO2_02_FULL_39_17]OGY53903.1 MAG: DNA protecting protein DprA [Candidatus Buchananbacteria bacterium RIFCSPLOWO2_01_FULL_40_23b]